jgi:nitrogen regulatory protein P-II 1
MSTHHIEYKKVHAITQHDALQRVLERLQEMHVHHITVTDVREYGEDNRFYAFRSSTRFARLEIFAEEDQAETIAQAIIDSAHTGLPSDGLVAILPAEKVYRIRTESEARSKDFRSPGDLDNLDSNNI